jgi:hypothetical protein
MFYFVEDNKIISGSRNYNCESGLKKRKIFNQHTSWLSAIVDPGRQPIVSFHIMYASVVHRVFFLVINIVILLLGEHRKLLTRV